MKHCAYCSIAPLIVAFAAFGQAQQPADFVPLFNGKDLSGWDGDPRFWSVDEGVIVGQTSESDKTEHNTFLIYRDRSFADFVLQFEYQVAGNNSGVQYRSQEVGPWRVTGYQADFEAQWHDDGTVDKHSGMFFEEGGRRFLAQRGQAVIVRRGEAPSEPAVEVFGTIGDADELASRIRHDDWNEYTVIARGHQFTHVINGQVMTIALDEDPEAYRAEGLLAFQLHSGPPMKIRIRNPRILPL